jgi:cobalt-zinc-cadmium efflux system protein
MLNICFALIELIGGFLTNSVAVMSDAVHDFGDALAIGLALAFEKKSLSPKDRQYSYGYRRYSVVAAFVTGLILCCGSLLMLAASVPRLFNPVEPHAPGMIGLALLGLIFNGFAAWKMSGGSSLNEKMVTWHLVEDVLGWIVVLVGAVCIYFFKIPQIDSILGILLSLWVFYNVLKNLKSTMNVFLQAVPDNFDFEHTLKHLENIQGVKGIHHIHLWSLDGESHIFTGHVVVQKNMDLQSIEVIKAKIKDELSAHGIKEATLEIEIEGFTCPDPEHV